MAETDKLNTADALTEFIKTFGAPIDPRFWYKLFKEETKELEEALVSGNKKDILKELCDVVYVYTPMHNFMEWAIDKDLFPDDEIMEMTNYLTSKMGVSAVAMSMFPYSVVTEAFMRVHKSNMSKVGDDGKPIKREDGKIMKGPNYKPPHLDDLVEKTE
jgi:hypothetical protein